MPVYSKSSDYTAPTGAQLQKIDLAAFADTSTVLRNPHKGWYHHFLDNSDSRYRGAAEDIMGFPGLDLIFIRLSWRHFEPQESVFDWRWIDSVKDIYVPRGLKIGLAITAKETGETYATPQWVSKAGAKGTLLNNGSIWEPEYNDPVFLEKLEKFHKACAARYDGQKWLSFVQIASYGSWGEGHNWPVSNKIWPDSVKIRHVDIHKKYYVHTPLCLSDDAYWTSYNKVQFKNDVESRGIFWTDHSILVTSYVSDFPNTFTIRSPELFTSTWKTRPTQLELEHYGKVKGANLWSVPNGTGKGADIVRGALALSHATWLGFHGDIKLWHSENPELAKELANKTGYWYFVRSVEIPDTITSGAACTLAVTWENRGVAPAYFGYNLKVKLQRGSAARVISPGAAGNRNWMPGIPVTSRYPLPLPEMAPGRYDLKIKLAEENRDTQTVFLALNDSLKDPEGYYRVASVSLGQGTIGTLEPPSSFANKGKKTGAAVFYDGDSRSIKATFESVAGSGGSNSIQWTLSNLAGRYVKQFRATRTPGCLQEELDVRSVPAGYYVVDIQTGGKTLLRIVRVH